MPHFEIPESVIAYLQESATRAVVDSLVSTLDDPILPDMDRKKLISLGEGVLLGCQVRADFVGFMASLWDYTFDAAIKNSGLNEIFPENCTIKEVWTERYFWSYVARGDDLDRRHFELTVQIDERLREVQLHAWGFEENGEFLKFKPLQVPAGWRQIKERDADPGLETAFTVTLRDLIDNSEVELAKLRKAASAAIELICKLLPK